jgi:hypothetical protein
MATSVGDTHPAPEQNRLLAASSGSMATVPPYLTHPSIDTADELGPGGFADPATGT